MVLINSEHYNNVFVIVNELIIIDTVSWGILE